MVVWFAPTYSAEQTTNSAKNDYITCWKQPCIYTAGSQWSEKNPNGVAVAVAIGKQSVVTDDQVKQVITADLNHYGVKNIKFFFENYEGVATAIALHVRGGTEGTYGIDTVRDEIKSIAQRAKNTNPIFKAN